MTAHSVPVRAAPLTLLFLGLTAAFVGYFQAWLPGPAAGLQIIGIEMGEWIKFLGAGPRRDLFYLPPIAIGLVIALVASTWPNDRPHTWIARGLAVAVSLLSFPAIAAIQMEPSSEWLLRLAMIVLVGVTAVVGAFFSRRGGVSPWPWLFMAAVSLLGAVLPTFQYFAFRPVAEEIMRRSIGIGLGVWLSAGGLLVVAAVALMEFFRLRRRQQKRQSLERRLSSDEPVRL